MKLLVKFEIKFLNFFTLKNLNNKKIHFLLPKKYCLYVSKQNYNYNLVVVHKTNTKLHNKTRVFLKTQNSTLGIHQFLPAKIRRFTLLNAVFYVVLNVKRELLYQLS